MQIKLTLLITLLSFFIFSEGTLTYGLATTNSNICIVEKEKLMTLVQNFENLQTKHDAQGIKKLFSAAALRADLSKNGLIFGTPEGDVGSLYNNAPTDFELQSFSILDNLKKNTEASCEIQVQENRRYYDHGVGGFAPTVSVTTNFILIQQQDGWKIDQYFYQNGPADNFGAWHFRK